MHHDRNEFDRMINTEYPANSTNESIDHTPYGTPAQPHKTGLTKRGKAALGIGATLLAGGTLVGYQNYAANVAESEAKAQELTLQSQALELEKIRELNRVEETTRKVTAGYDKDRQKRIDECVKTHSDQVGKGFGSPQLRDVVDACQAQYAPTTSTDAGMQEAGSTTDTAGGGGISPAVLLGLGTGGALLIAVAANRGKKNHAA